MIPKRKEKEERSKEYQKVVTKEIKRGIKYNGKFSVEMAPFLEEYKKNIQGLTGTRDLQTSTSHVIVVLPRKLFYDGKVKLQEFNLSLNQFIGCCLGGMIVESPELIQFVTEKIKRRRIQKDRSTVPELDFVPEEPEVEPMDEVDFVNSSLEEEIKISGTETKTDS